MNNEQFSQLTSEEQYLLVLYTLFTPSGTDARQIKAVMTKLLGKKFVDLKSTLSHLGTLGFLHQYNYNWRTDTFDYCMAPLMVAPLMTYIYQEQKEMAISVLKAAAALKPEPVQRALWTYISSDFTVVPFEEMDKSGVTEDMRYFIPVALDTNFIPLLQALKVESLFDLLSTVITEMLQQEALFDTSGLRSLTDSYQKSSGNSDAMQRLTCLLDLYDFLAYGTRPLNLLATNKNHCIIGAITEAYRGNTEHAFELYAKALQLHNADSSRYAPRVAYFFLEILNFFFVLVCYLDGSSESLRKALTVYKVSTSAPTDAARTLYRILFENAGANEVRFAINGLLRAVDATDKALGQLLAHYIGMTVDDDVQPQWLILKHEMRKYVPLSPEDEAKADAAYGAAPLLSSIYHKQEWETVLDDLMGKNKKKETASERKPARVMYHIDKTTDRYAEMRVQTILKSGAWSAGKAVNNYGFFAKELPEMDDADKRIVDAAKVDGVSYGSLRLRYVLPEMLQESRLYVGGYAPFTLVQVTEEMPYLNITRTPAGFEITSNVNIDDIESNVVIVKTTATSINFVQLTPQQQVYYKRLLTLKRFPLEAEEQLREFLGGIGGKIEVNSDLIEGGSTLPIVDGQSQLVLQMRPNDRSTYAVSLFVRPLEGGRVKCKPASGDEVIIDCDEDRHYTRVQRDKKKEKRYLKAMAEATEIDLKPLMKTDVVDAFDMLPLVEYAQQNADSITCEWQEGAHIKVTSRSGSSWGGAIRKNENGWFELEGSVELEPGKVMTMAQLLDLVSQSHGRYIKLGDGEFIALSDKLHRQLSQLNAIAARSHGKLQMSPFSAALLGADVLMGEMTLEEDNELKQIRQRIVDASKYTPDVPAALNATLRNYQKEGYCWMARLNKWGAGALLADDMGLGKTIQTITFLLLKAPEGPALVVAPASVAPNWKTEFEKFAPSLNVKFLNFAEDRQAMVKDAAAGDVVITTYGLLLSVKDYVVPKHWTTICLDEAHIIKNRGAKTSAVAMQLKSDNRVMLTGTPVQNHLGELWNLFQFVNPGLLGPFEDFSRRFIVPIEQNHDKMQQKELDRLVKPFMLRRTKDKVAKELPEKEEIYQHVTMSEEEMLVYEVMRRRAEALLMAEGGGKVSMNTLAEITRLRQCACDVRLVAEGKKSGTKSDGAKITALIELLQTIIEGLSVDRKGVMQGGVLVFSQFTSYLTLVKKALKAAKIPFLYIDGTVDIKTRQKLVEEFQNGSCPVFLISLKAGGLGLNLTRANYVIHMDPWWNPAIEAQATDRVHRIGQKKSVTVYHLIAEGTIEEKIQRLHEQKQALVQNILESTDMSHKLTGEDLLEMVRH